jgi:hypothetical protein
MPMRADRVIFTNFMLIAVFAPRAWAHDATTLDAMPSAHGGQVRMAGPYHIELLLEGKSAAGVRPIRVYLQNHAFEAVTSSGMIGIVKLTDGTIERSITLKPTGINSLIGSGSYSSNQAMVAVVSVTTKDGQVLSATFTPFAKTVNTR